MRVLARTLSILCVLAWACGGSGPVPTPTQAMCPAANPPTWDGFAKPFFDSYCTRCHSSALSGEARMGAPEFHDFDTRDGADRVLNHIDEQAGSGPAATNEIMPISAPKPSKQEREMLGQWIACECQMVVCTVEP